MPLVNNNTRKPLGYVQGDNVIEFFIIELILDRFCKINYYQVKPVAFIKFVKDSTLIPDVNSFCENIVYKFCVVKLVSQEGPVDR